MSLLFFIVIIIQKFVKEKETVPDKQVFIAGHWSCFQSNCFQENLFFNPAINAMAI